MKLLNLADITACPDLFASLAGTVEVDSQPADRATLEARLPGCDIYFATLHVRLDSELLKRATQLKVIVTPSTGLDHIDLDTARDLGIRILSLKEDTEFLDSVTATAELAWGLLLSTVRRLPAAVCAARAGHWARDEFRGHQLSGKTLGILGYGRLGRMVAEYGKAFRMRVLTCEQRDVVPAEGVQLVDFETLLRESDVLSFHIHLTEANRHLIDATALSLLKPGAVLINTSRGAIVDEAALLESLRSGHLGGAGLDVIDGEWSATLDQHPLIRYMNEHDNLIITPHIGGVTFESQSMACRHMVQKLQNYLASAAKE